GDAARILRCARSFPGARVVAGRFDGERGTGGKANRSNSCVEACHVEEAEEVAVGGPCGSCGACYRADGGSASVGLQFSGSCESGADAERDSRGLSRPRATRTRANSATSKS